MEKSKFKNSFDQLPSVDEMIETLTEQNVPLKKWNEVAHAYYIKGGRVDFIKLLETALNRATDNAYTGFNKDLMHTNDMLGSYYIMLAREESCDEKKRELLEKASRCYKIGDLFLTNDVYHLLGKAYLCLNRGDQMDRADVQFSLVLSLSPSNIHALFGKACIAFNKKEFGEALNYFKKAVRSSNNCPAHARLGMGHCFLKLNKLKKAKLAYQRALQLDPNCVGAYIGLAILKLNIHKPASTKKGVKMLSEAYALDSTNAMAMNHLANHFFFKREYEKAKHLAMHAFNSTKHEGMRAESCYHLARIFHVQGDYNMAFSYYYQSSVIAPRKFVLPHYGLGQMYISRDDMKSAELCFEKVLAVEPNNYETMKILGSLYAKSSSEEKRNKALLYMKQIIQKFPNDEEAWIHYAQLLEREDFQTSWDAYNTAQTLLEAKGITSLEILNNIAALEYRMNKMLSAKEKLEKALEYTPNKGNLDKKYFESSTVTIKYNLARTNEAIYSYDIAEQLYKQILMDHPNYIDSYLRLGCMARNKGLIFAASDFFKDALNIDKKHPDARSLLGNLHLTKMQFNLAQKNYEAIVKNPVTSKDVYAHISLANLYLVALHQPLRNKNNDHIKMQIALKIYRKVLVYDPSNIWATNGVGAILAHQGCYAEAESIFSMLREAFVEFSDLWLNIAHLYMVKKNYGSAIQMYENCIKKFDNHHNVEIMQYLAKAYFHNGLLVKARNVLLKALHLAPHDTILILNTALVMQHMSKIVIQSQFSTWSALESSVKDMQVAHRYFQFVSKKRDSTRHDIELATREANRCEDLLLQSQYHVDRARHISEDVKARRIKQMEECLKVRQRMLDAKPRHVRIAKTCNVSERAKCLELVAKTKIKLMEPGATGKKRNARGRKNNNKELQNSDTENQPNYFWNSHLSSARFEPSSESSSELEEKADMDTPSVDCSNVSPGICESIDSDDILELDNISSSTPVKRGRYCILEDHNYLSD